MHEAKLGIGSDAQGRRKTAHRALGAVESHEDPRIWTARELVDEENGAFTEADDALCRGADHRLRIGNLAGGADEDQIRLGRNPFPDNGTKWVPGAHADARRRCNAHRGQLGNLASKKRFRAVDLLFGQTGGQANGNDMQERDPLCSAVPAKLCGPLPSLFGPIGEIGRKQNVRDFAHLVLNFPAAATRVQLYPGPAGASARWPVLA
jgi:hypothetical protein